MTENCDWWEIGLALLAVVSVITLALFLLGEIDLPHIVGL